MVFTNSVSNLLRSLTVTLKHLLDFDFMTLFDMHLHPPQHHSFILFLINFWVRDFHRLLDVTFFYF